MSFDIFLQSSHRSGRKAEISNPFTGETQVAEVDDPLTDEERSAVQALLDHYGAESADEFGYYTPTFDDGTSIEAQFKGLADDPDFSGGMISLHGTSNAITDFLFQIADAGNFIMQPIMEGNPAIVTKTSTADSVSTRLPEVLVVQSAADVASIISTGVDAWDKYRRQVT